MDPGAGFPLQACHVAMTVGSISWLGRRTDHSCKDDVESAVRQLPCFRVLSEHLQQKISTPPAWPAISKEWLVSSRRVGAQGLPKLLWEAGSGSPATSLTGLQLLLDAGRTAAVGSPLAAALGDLQVLRRAVHCIAVSLPAVGSRSCGTTCLKEPTILRCTKVLTSYHATQHLPNGCSTVLRPCSRSWRLCSVRCCLHAWPRGRRLATHDSWQGHWPSCRRLTRCLAAACPGPCLGGHPSLQHSCNLSHGGP